MGEVNESSSPRRGRFYSLRPAAAEFARTSFSIFPVLALLRGYEYALVRSAHIIPAGGAKVLLWALLADFVVTMSLAAFLAIPVIALSHRRARLGRAVHRILLVIVVLIGVALSQYFAVTFVPLGADLFGYSLDDVRQTTASGTSFGIVSLLPFLVFGGLTWLSAWIFARVPVRRAGLIAFYAALPIVLLFRGPLGPKPAAFGSDAAYYLAENKVGYFADNSLRYAWGRWAGSDDAGGLTGYPLMHAARYDDVLGPYLDIGPEKPNLVFISIEGLGRDFVGEGARYGGFTPYLDSLATRSLYWENFLSTTGRTFGMLPSLLGSLPFSDAGFMQLGSRMPRHQTLASLLAERGYHTSYFTGTYGNWELIDVFMERQNIARFVDQSSFGAGYERQPAEGNFSWGYGDHDLFRRSLEVLASPTVGPRLEIYSTTTTHEPFIPPRTAEYLAAFERRLAAMDVTAGQRATYRKYASIFATLMYTDDAIRFFFTEYAKRDDFDRTIFFVTGDHRLVPIPEDSRIARFHVPFWVVSKMVKAPRRFSSVSSHLDVAPSVLALMKHNYGMSFPDQAHWLGAGIDTAGKFRSLRSLALMRTKNQLDAYLDGANFLSDGDLYRLEDGLRLTSIRDPDILGGTRAKLARFRELNRYVTSGNNLLPGSATDPADSADVAKQDSTFRARRLDQKTPTDAFVVARGLASQGDYESARLIARRLLRDSPNFHDARALLGRAYAWDGKWDDARVVLEDLVRRAPAYTDAHAALIDVELWSGHAPRALALADSALEGSPGNTDLLLGRARALEAMGRARDAIGVLDGVLARDASNADAARLRRRIRP